jgi:VWFA-related protein
MCGLSGGMICAKFGAIPRAQAQSSSSSTTENAGAVIHAETRLVLVDAVVTDKKGNYIRDLSQKDFRVWEDNKEQTIKSFSSENDEGSPSNPQKHYLVLFFDNSSMTPGDQKQARDAAAKFIERNAGPNRLIAVVDFTGGVHIAQNFTADAERLKKVVGDVKFSWTSPNPSVEVASLGMPSIGQAEAEFGIRNVLLALRSVAKGLGTVPGRKSLVFLTAGFPRTNETESELTATIDSCNKANVAVYPIDVRGLVAPMSAIPGGSAPASRRARLVAATVHEEEYSSDGGARLVYVQHSGGGGGGHSGGGGFGGGGHVGGGTGAGAGRVGGTGGTRSTGGVSRGPSMPAYNPAYQQPRQILLPPLPSSVSDNQQVLYMLAEGTGGFVILNSNDLVGGMERIAHDQGQYYLLGYTPSESAEGSCHTLKVKIDRGGTVVRSRSGYCNVRPPDLLAGKPQERELENRAKGSQPGNITASLAAPFFYTSANTARVNLAMEIPAGKIKFEKEKGKEHAAVNILGIATKADGSVAARFSDTVNFDFDGKKEVEEFQKKPFEYENQFDVASGQYTLKVAFSSGGESFGKVEAPLAIDPYDGKQFGLSAMALSKQLRRVSDMATGLDAMLLEDRTPLVTGGVQIVPTADTHFKQGDPAAIYVEIYEPLMVASATPPKVDLLLNFVDRKTGQSKISAAYDKTQPFMHPGSPVIPVGVRVPLDKLGPGSYRLEMKAVDSAGQSSVVRAADFEVD